MPMRRTLAKRSTAAMASMLTRATMDPTLRQAMRMSWVTAVFEVLTASQATVSSKASVCPASCRAQGTAATTTPWSRQVTRGASASSASSR